MPEIVGFNLPRSSPPRLWTAKAKAIPPDRVRNSITDPYEVEHTLCGRHVEVLTAGAPINWMRQLLKDQ